MSGLSQYLAFAQTARRASFAAAARDLGQAPSTLAKSVARLEAALGVKLFHRTTRQVSLTPDGERLYRRCERVLAEVEDLQAEAAGTRAAPSGILRIDAPIAYGRRILMPLFARLLEEEYVKLRHAGNRDVHDDSKDTTLPIARAIVEAYVTTPVKAPWYIDLLNLNLDNHDLARARERIARYQEAFRRDGTRVTENLDFERAVAP